MSLHERHQQVLDKCVAALKDWKKLILAYVDERDQHSEINKLKKITKDYCEIENNFQRSKRVLLKVEEQLNANEDSTINVDQLYDENIKNEASTSGEDYMDNEIWQTLFEGSSDVVEVKKKKSKLDDTQFEELGDSLLCSIVFTPPIDPISRTVIRNPYKNKICKHVYENSTIINYIKQTKNKAKCPYIGCNNNNLRMVDLVEDNQLQSQITQYLENENEENSQDED